MPDKVGEEEEESNMCCLDFLGLLCFRRGKIILRQKSICDFNLQWILPHWMGSGLPNHFEKKHYCV